MGVYDLGDLTDDIKDNADFLLGGILVGTLNRAFGLFGDKDTPEKTPVLSNSRSTVAPVPVIYGARRVGGTVVYVAVAGEENEHLHLVLTLSEGPINSVPVVYLDDIPSTDARFTFTRRKRTGVDENGEPLYFDFSTPHVVVETYLGTDGQAASAALIAAFPGVWTANHTLSGVAYLHVRLTFTQDIFSRVPVITADVEGRTLFDPRTSTTAFSRNPALCVRDYLTNTRYGKGVPSAQVDVTAAANHCDDVVALYAGGPVDNLRYTCNGVLDTGKRIADNVRRLTAACNGTLTHSGGIYRLKIDQVESAEMDFNTDIILGGWSIASTGNNTLLNRINISFDNPDKNWQEDSVVYDDATLRSSQDNGSLLEASMTLPFTPNLYRAQRLAQLQLLKSRLKLRVAFMATLAALRVDVGAVVSVTHPTPAWTAKLFRVVKLDLLPTGNIGVALEEYSASAYTVQLPGQFVAPPATSLPNPFTVLAPGALTLESGTAHLLVGTAGDIISRIYARWTQPYDTYVVGYNVQAKRSNADVWLPVASPASATDVKCYIAPVLDSVAYDVRVRSVNSLQRRSAWVTVSDYMVIGKTEPPPPLLAFSLTRQPDGTRQYEWTYGVEPPDLDGARLYWKADTGGTPPALSAMTILKTAELIQRPVRALENNQLPADTYWFAAVTVDTTGNESTPLYIQADLDEPRIQNAILQVNEQPAWVGTKTDCFVQDSKVVANAAYTWASLTTWTALTAWNSPSVSPISYTTLSIDVGAIIQFSPIISASVLGTKTLEIRWGSDNVAWSAWTAYAAQSVLGRYLQARITVSGTTPEISALNIVIAAPVVDEYFNDIDCATSAKVTVTSTGVVQLNLTKTYATITYVNPVIQSIPAGDEWKATVTGKATTGPVVTFYKKIAGTWTLTTPTSSTPVDFYVRGA